MLSPLRNIFHRSNYIGYEPPRPVREPIVYEGERDPRTFTAAEVRRIELEEIEHMRDWGVWFESDESEETKPTDTAEMRDYRRYMKLHSPGEKHHAIEKEESRDRLIAAGFKITGREPG